MSGSNRRAVLGGLGGFLATSLWAPGVDAERRGSAFRATDDPHLPNRGAWEHLDEHIKANWQHEVASSSEERIRADKSGQLLFVPFPYVDEFGAPSEVGILWAWDMDFLCRGLLAHERFDLARNLILDHLFMIERFGFVPNGNALSMKTRSQTPLTADTVWRFCEATGDRELLYQAYPLLKVNYRDYWNAPHHQTPIGLATNRDLGDPALPPALAAEAETGLDWTPIFGGDVRRCVPILTNCALVRYARVLARMATTLSHNDEAREFREDAEHRAALVRKYCWNESVGYFLEYDYVGANQLSCLSDCAFWTLWARIATPDQARRLVQNLYRIEKPFGIACTDKAYPQPLPDGAYEFPGSMNSNGKPAVMKGVPTYAVGGQGQLQWMYPAGWPPMQIIVAEGLDMYGFGGDATRLAAHFLWMVIKEYGETGLVWEKYNVAGGTIALPNSRYGVVPNFGWTKAAVAVLGRRLFLGEQLTLKPCQVHGSP